jgi:hypothetical protein
MKTSRIILLFSILITVRLNGQDSINFNLTQIIDNTGANDIVLADFNFDNSLDAFIANGIWNKPLPSKLWINDGKGRFTDSKQNIGNSKSWSVASRDLNDDGFIDAFISNGDWNNGDSSHIWINDGHGIFSCSPIKLGKANTSCAALGDLNGDNKIDIFLANHPYSDGSGGEDEIWFNDGKGNFIISGQKLGDSDAARRVKMADIDMDRDLDLIVLNGGINRIWINNGTGEFTKSRQNIGSGENIDLALGDIDKDEDMDIIIAKGAWGKSPKGIVVWTNDGIGNFSKTQNIGDFDSYGLSLGDFNNDEYLDIVVVNAINQANQLYINDKQGHFIDSKIKIGTGGNKVAIGDLNNDNLTDILIIGNEDTRVYLQTKKIK